MVLEDLLSAIGLPQLVFVRILLFLLFFILIFVGLKRMPFFGKNRLINAIVSLVISIFASRFMPDEMLMNYIANPYTIIGMIFLVGAPFILLFFLTFGTGLTGVGRRLIWFAYGVIYLVVWYGRYGGLSSQGKIVFYVGLGLIVLSLLLDKSFDRYARWRKRKKDLEDIS